MFFQRTSTTFCSGPVNPTIVVKLLESEDDSANILRNVINYLPEIFAVLEYWAAYSVTDVSGQPNGPIFWGSATAERCLLFSYGSFGKAVGPIFKGQIIAQRSLIFSYRRFEKTCRPKVQGSGLK
jgi:hypothetical protein